MSSEPCYLCKNPLPSAQSFYEDHGKKVCLKCFQSTARCRRCRFPSKSLKAIESHGMVCEFCQEVLLKDTGLSCYLCEKKIWAAMSHYADHGKTVCQECFKNTKIRCFFCRFPNTQEMVSGVGGICEFCIDQMVSQKSDLSPLMQPLRVFLQQHGHSLGEIPEIKWLDWKLIMGMQLETPPKVEVKFFDELVYLISPVYYLKGKLYCMPRIPQPWFMSALAGQLVAWELCQKYHLDHLQGSGPFQQLARGWSHYISYSTAKILNYQKVIKVLARFPEGDAVGNFPKFLAMTEYRKPKDIISFAQKELSTFAQRYLSADG